MPTTEEHFRGHPRARAAIGTVKRYDVRQPVATATCANCKGTLYRFTWEGGESGWLHEHDDRPECEFATEIQGDLGL